MPKLPRDIGCSVADCDGRTYAKGLCAAHYRAVAPSNYKPRFRPGRVSCKRSVADNLAACSDRDASTGCLVWTGSINANGYGLYGASKAAHRVSYEATNGPIPQGLCVCHHCDNPRCIEPAHLFLGTNQDNTNDRVMKGRSAFVKLTVEQVKAIKADSRGRRAVAAEYGVSVTTIQRIINNRAWRLVA